MPNTFWENLKEYAKPERTEYVAPILYFLAKYMNAKVTAEIGSLNGYCTVALATAMKENVGVHYVIELSKTNIKKTEEVCKIYNIPEYVFYYEGDSQKIEFTRKLDLLFVDGDHGENKVIHEIQKYWPLINKNGLMCFHDHLAPKSVGVALNGSSVREFREQAEVINLPYDSGLTIWRKK